MNSLLVNIFYTKNEYSKGFTLIELLVVISIIGVLATLVLLQLNVARAKARDAKRVTDMASVRTALELYFDDNGAYPSSNNMSSISKYLLNIPQDPSNPSCSNNYNGFWLPPPGVRCYGYGWRTSGGRTISYQVWAELERGTQALESDDDITFTLFEYFFWSGNRIQGSNEDCDSNSVGDCVFDFGSKN